MAVDCGRALRTWLRGGTTLRVGFRPDRTRNAGTSRSTQEAGCSGILSLRAEPDVPGILRGLDRAVGNLRKGQHRRNRGRLRCYIGCRFICAAV